MSEAFPLDAQFRAEQAARRAAIGDTRDWIEAAARLKAAGFDDGVIQRAEAEVAARKPVRGVHFGND